MNLVSSLEVLIWIIKDKPVPVPHKIKIKVISDYTYKFKTTILIETGTYLGQTVDDLEFLFDSIYSIELDKILYTNAKKMFNKSKNIQIIRGDSSKILPKIINKIKLPSLFWLDAHYSKGLTAKGNKETPILDELNSISKSKVKNHVILIDDARKFNGLKDYPTTKQIKKIVHQKFLNYKVVIKKDIIRIYPNEI